MRKSKLLITFLALGILFGSAISVLGATVKTAPEPLPTPTPAKVEYFLAYPGVLPDHFLYPLKMIRDRIWLFLTTDPVKKTESLLLFADKRLGAGKALIEGGKSGLGITTLGKAEKYLEQAISQEKIARGKGVDTKALLEKLSLAIQKHEEILLELEKKVSQSEKTAVSDLLRYPRQGYEMLGK